MSEWNTSENCSRYCAGSLALALTSRGCRWKMKLKETLSRFEGVAFEITKPRLPPLTRKFGCKTGDKLEPPKQMTRRLSVIFVGTIHSKLSSGKTPEIAVSVLSPNRGPAWTEEAELPILSVYPPSYKIDALEDRTSRRLVRIDSGF